MHIYYDNLGQYRYMPHLNTFLVVEHDKKHAMSQGDNVSFTDAAKLL